MNKKLCDKECTGTIKDIKYGNHIRYLIVEYEVNGKNYKIKESEITKPYKKIKLGIIPIGYKSKPLIEIKSGNLVMLESKVKVRYCSSNPSIAFLPDNDAKITWD